MTLTKRIYCARLGAALLSGVIAASPLPAGAAPPPTEQLKPAIDRVTQVLQDRGLRAPARAGERRQAIRKITDEVFDWEEMSRRALGVHWSRRTPAEQQEFVKAFTGLLERAYIGRIERYSGERIAFTGESVDGDRGSVRTQVVAKQGPPISIEYRLLRHGELWRVYDVAVENVSLVGNYRSQFEQVLSGGSYEELLRRLRAASS